MKINHLIIASLLTSITSIAALAEQTSPKPVYQPKPIYAFELCQARMEGAVEVSYTVDTKGNLTKLNIISSTNRVFEEPTRDALRRWKFTPAMKDGQPISTEAKLLVTYTGSWNNPETRSEALETQLLRKKG